MNTCVCVCIKTNSSKNMSWHVAHVIPILQLPDYHLVSSHGTTFIHVLISLVHIPASTVDMEECTMTKNGHSDCLA